MNNKKILIFAILACIYMPANKMLSAESITASTLKERGHEILKKSDRSIYPEEGYVRFSIDVTDEENNKRHYKLEAYKKGRNRQTVVWLSPRMNRNDVGMRKNKTIYYKAANMHKPHLTHYLSVFLKSDLCWGDIISSDFAWDYEVSEIEKRQKDNRHIYILELTPTSKNMYARIDTVIDSETYRPLKRIYYTASGSVMKKAHYSGYKVKDGNVTGYTLVMQDDFMGSTTRIVFKNIEEKQLPAFLFNPKNIGRIHASN